MSIVRRISRYLSIEQDVKPCLLEMMVARQDFGDVFIRHHGEGYAIRKRPVLVRALGKKGNAFIKEIGRCPNQNRGWVGAETLHKPDKKGTCTPPRHERREFHQNVIRCDDLRTKGFQERNGGRMMLVAIVEQGKVKRRGRENPIQDPCCARRYVSWFSDQSSGRPSIAPIKQR